MSLLPSINICTTPCDFLVPVAHSTSTATKSNENGPCGFDEHVICHICHKWSHLNEAYLMSFTYKHLGIPVVIRIRTDPS
jgi:hypothetical protein